MAALIVVNVIGTTVIIVKHTCGSDLTMTLKLGVMSMCTLCWSYCLCREVVVGVGVESSPVLMLASRNACESS